MNEALRFFPRAHLTAKLRLEEFAFHCAKLRAGRESRQRSDVPAVQQRLDFENLRKLEAAADGAHRRGQLPGDVLAGIVKRDDIRVAQESLQREDLAQERIAPSPAFGKG